MSTSLLLPGRLPNGHSTNGVGCMAGKYPINTVYFDTSMSREEVRDSLINHDGFSSSITITKGRTFPKRRLPNEPSFARHRMEHSERRSGIAEIPSAVLYKAAERILRFR